MVAGETIRGGSERDFGDIDAADHFGIDVQGRICFADRCPTTALRTDEAPRLERLRDHQRHDDRHHDDLGPSGVANGRIAERRAQLGRHLAAS
jgi:hypothetical protein